MPFDPANPQWADWQAATPAEKAKYRDPSDLHPQLVGLEGKRVRVEPKREYGLTTFRVGKSTGWKPIHLAMRNDPRQRGSSDIVRAEEVFTRVTVLRD